jgi:predicted AAA+ superfamily ATPase
MTPYRPRDVASAVTRALRTMPVVVLTGLRQAGKTTFLQREPGLSGRRYVTLDDFAQLEAARRDPAGLLDGDEPITVDEAHKCPEVFAAVKRAVDRGRRPGRFLLSGSANLSLLAQIGDTLAGRAVHLTLHPFTRREIAGDVGSPAFLQRFFERPQTLPATGPAPRLAAADVLRGGMPSVCLDEAEDPAIWFRGYEQTYLERDVRALAAVSDLSQFRRFLKLAALRTAQVLNVSELGRDAQLPSSTAARWLSLLEASFVITRLPPFLGNRASRVIKSPKLHLADAGLVAHLAGVTSIDGDEPMRGALIETYVAQNLAGVLAARWPEASLGFWSVQGRHEVDFVVECGRDSVAVEVKAAARWNDRDLAGLEAFLGATPRCRAAILAYAGTDAVRLGDRLWALPISLVLS